MLKKLLGLSVALLLLVQCSEKGGESEAAQGPRTQKIIVTFVLGKAFVKSEAGAWESIKVGRLMQQKDMVRISEHARVVMQTETGSVITLKDTAELVISSVLDPKTREEKTSLDLNSGKVVVNPRKLEGSSSFAVRTPSMVAGVRGTIFTVEHKNGSSTVAVKEGKVAVRPNVETVKGVSLQSSEQKLVQIEVNPGEKAEVDQAQVERVAKEIQGDLKQEQLQEIRGAVEVKSLSSEENKIVEEDSTALVKLDIAIEKTGITGAGDSEEQFAPVTVSSYGKQIFINGKKVADDYYSSLYTRGTSLDIEILQGTEKVHSEKIQVPAQGVRLNFTTEEEQKEDLEKVSEFQTQPYRLVTQGVSASGEEMYQAGKNIILSSTGQVQILSAENPAQSVKISSHPNVESALTPDGIFVSSRAGNLELYGFDGVRKNEVKLGNIIFKTAISYHGGVGYLANSTGRVIGVNAAGDKILDVSVKDSLVAPIAIQGDKLFAASAYKLYVIQDGRVVNSFRLNGKVFKRMGVLEDRLILPQDNGKIAVVNFQGETLKEISAVAGDISVLSSDRFAVQYGTKTLIFSLQGEKIKEINTGKTVMVGTKVLYADGQNFVVVNAMSGEEKKTQLPEKIKGIGIHDGKAILLSEDGKLYEMSF